MLICLQKGLRVRTIKQRVHSASRIQTWARIVLREDWITCVEHFESFLIDMAENPKVGLTSFERARLGVMYLEGAAGIKSANSVGSDPAVKATIKELELRVAARG